MTRKIVPLPKEQWKDCVVPIGYTSHAYYDLELLQEEAGFTASFRLKPMEPPVVHTPEEHDFADRLYADYWDGAFAWGVVEDGKLLAAIETCPEEWNNRLRVTELWVSESLRHQGVGACADGTCQRTGPPGTAARRCAGNPVVQCQRNWILFARRFFLNRF